MKSFSQFREEKKKTLVTAFGRFNPPTVGHQKLIDKVAKVAGKNDYQIYPSQSQDAKKNPLSYNDKVKFMRKMFPKHARNIYMDKNVKMALHIAVRAYKEGYTEFVYVAGSDRVNEFKVLLNKYNGKEGKHGFYNFKDGIQVVSAGERDPDAEGVSGMSASKMRAAAADNDLELFATGLPKNFGEVQELLNAVRKGMGLKESFIFRKHIALPKVSDIREQYTEGKLFNVGDRVTKAGVELRVIERKPNFVVCENAEKVTFKCWLEDLQPIEEGDEDGKKTLTDIQLFVKKNIDRTKLKNNGFPMLILKYGEDEDIEYKSLNKAAKDDLYNIGYYDQVYFARKNMMGGVTIWIDTKNTIRGKKIEKGQVDEDLKGPDRYYGDEMAKSTKKSRSAHFKKYAKMDDDNPAAYKKAPGDASAKTKPSKYTKKYQQLYGKKK